MAEKNDDALLLAKKHYKLLEENRYEEWLHTFESFVEKQTLSGIRGTGPEFYWNAGRRWVDGHGVHYEYEKEDPVDDSRRRRFYFNRKDDDGKNVGYHIVINVVREGNNWKVLVPSY